ncbi:hypothetical protein QZH41_001422 [Actinostola sp. cb2023]|nr:hypothetical protein QZH41_001422 [Actinostola sp. cb2023]
MPIKPKESDPDFMPTDTNSKDLTRRVRLYNTDLIAASALQILLTTLSLTFTPSPRKAKGSCRGCGIPKSKHSFGAPHKNCEGP